MNITKSNFAEHYGEILQSINEADYIAFDTEFTGLSDKTIRIHQFESLEDRYLKIKRHIELFWICQLGIATFNRGANDSEYTAKIFNIYMHPTNRLLNVSMSSMSFLVEHGFDMNLLFRDAIPCSKPNDCKWNNSASHQGSFALSEKNLNFLQDLEMKICDFIKSDQKAFSVEVPDEHLKKLVMGSHGVAPRFKYLEMKYDKNSPLLLRINKNKKKAAEHIPKTEQVSPDNEPEPNSLYEILRALLGKKVPLIGHYMILDLAFLFEHFFGYLPSSLEEFRQALNTHFPPLYDTKYMCKALFSNVKFIKKTRVEDLYSYCKKKKELSDLVNITPHEKYNASAQAHEAGFDAYMTGYIFINLYRFLPNPSDLNIILGKVCIQGHYKEFIDTLSPNLEDFNFSNVVKIKTSLPLSVYELSKYLSMFSDVFVIQEEELVFYADFQLTESGKLDEILHVLNSQNYRAVRFIDRALIN